jgi:hypothetical protein
MPTNEADRLIVLDHYWISVIPLADDYKSPLNAPIGIHRVSTRSNK